MKDFLSEFIKGLARWPLLLGAAICFTLAIYEETVTDNTEILIGVAGLVIGAVLLGGWLVSYVVDGERRHYGEKAPRWREEPETAEPPDTASEGSVDGGAGGS